MPEKVTREEKIIELAILKAREVKALRDGLTKDEMPTIEKVKRPKAQSYKANYKQDPDHANAGGEESKSGNIKKAMSQGQMQRKAEELRSFAMITDRKIRVMIAKGVLSKEEIKEIKKLEADIKEAEEWVTGYLKGKFGSSGSSDEKKSNQLTDKTNDPRDISRTHREGKAIVNNLKVSNKDMRELSSERLSSTLEDSVKLEADMRLLLDNLIMSKDTSNADNLR
tara:strand:+ start:32 stop:706 length:675 start_codon:yes stop_codon:yes gene_type:complete